MRKNYVEPVCSLVLLDAVDLMTASMLSYNDSGSGDTWDWGEQEIYE